MDGKRTFRQFLRYCLVGGANTFVDLLALNVLLWRIPDDTMCRPWCCTIPLHILAVH